MAFRDFGSKPVLASAGKQTNPTDQFVHADTGALNTGRLKDMPFEFRIVLGGSALAIWQIQLRNAANNATNSPGPYTVYTAAGQSAEVILALNVAAGERVRVTNDGAITGTTAAFIQAEPLT